MLLEEAYESGQFYRDDPRMPRSMRSGAMYSNGCGTWRPSIPSHVFRSGGHVRTEEEHAMVEGDIPVGHPSIKGKNTAQSLRAATICYYTQGSVTGRSASGR